jgi:DnaJ-domain-containing protein 1
VGIIDRLGDVLKSYINTDAQGAYSRGRVWSGDSDLDAAFEELDQYLNNKSAPKTEYKKSFKTDGAASGGTDGQRSNAQRGGESKAQAPETLRADFTELGVPFGASADECKAAHKKLLKIHHPDRHAGHEANMKKATAKSARINNSYERICAWRKTGRV